MSAERICVVIPAKNEAAAIGRVLSDVRDSIPGDAVIVIDDASDDTTADIAKTSGAMCVSHMESLGAWQATQTGLIYAKSLGFTRVVTMDADGQHLGSEIRKLIEVMDSESLPDVVIGSFEKRASLAKKIVWNLFRKISGVKVDDITSGFRVYNKKALELLVSQRASLLEYQDVGVLLLLKSSGIKISEVPVKMDKRFDGESRIFSSWLKILYYLTSTLIISLSKILHKNGER